MAKKRDKAIIINRNKYNEIRKMDHNSMEEYINGIYEKGMIAGRKEAPAAGYFKVLDAMERIKGIKGIGEVKLKQIQVAIMQTEAAGVNLEGSRRPTA